ncbi:hypothetical protein HN873_029704, partial [Arachis hypogaea]
MAILASSFLPSSAIFAMNLTTPHSMDPTSYVYSNMLDVHIDAVRRAIVAPIAAASDDGAVAESCVTVVLAPVADEAHPFLLP